MSDAVVIVRASHSFACGKTPVVHVGEVRLRPGISIDVARISRCGDDSSGGNFRNEGPFPLK